jgi:hypothetical protein
MKIRKIELLMFVFLIALPLSFAFSNITGISCSNVILKDSFDYTNAFSSHGWQLTDGSCDSESVYMNSPMYAGNPFATGAFGYNHTTPCSFAYTRSIRRGLPSVYSSGEYIFIINLSIINDTIQLVSTFWFSFGNTTSNSSASMFDIRIDHAFSKLNTTITNNFNGGENCVLNNPLGNFTGSFILDFNFDTKKYSAYFNNTGYDECVNKNLGVTSAIGNIRLNTQTDSLETLKAYADDVTFCQGTVLSSSVVNSGNCTDTDGYDPYHAGTVIFGNYTFNDYCESGNNQHEFVCSGNVVEEIPNLCSLAGENYFCNSATGSCEQTTPQTCTYPALFCDNFNYGADVSTKGWIPTDAIGNSISLAPNGLELNFTDNAVIQNLQHRLQNFNILYIPSGQSGNILNSTCTAGTCQYFLFDMQYTPLMSAQFDFIPYSGCFYYKGVALVGAEIFDVAFCADNISNNGNYYNNAVFFKNTTGSNNASDSNWSPICSDCIVRDSLNNFKIVSKFKNRDYYKEFNSSNGNDSVTIYLNSQLVVNYGLMEQGQSNPTDSLKIFTFNKDMIAVFALDNYYIYTGDNLNYDTTHDYFASTELVIFEQPSNTTSGTGITSGDNADFASQISKIWDTLGLHSFASRAIFGLILLFLLAVFYLLACFAFSFTPSPIILLILEVLAIILEVVVQLIAFWIIIIFVILSVIVILITVATKRGG